MSNVGGAFWKQAGFSYLQYIAISSRVLRVSLKEPAKSKALAREIFYYNKTPSGKDRVAVTSILSNKYLKCRLFSSDLLTCACLPVGQSSKGSRDSTIAEEFRELKTLVEKHLRANPTVDQAAGPSDRESDPAVAQTLLQLQQSLEQMKNKIKDLEEEKGALLSLSGGKTVAEASTGKGGLGKETVLLVIASNRNEYLKRTLERVVRFHPRGGGAVPIIVSEDGRSPVMEAVVVDAEATLRTADPSASLTHIHHPTERGVYYENGYFKLAEHFKWALNQVFADVSVQRVIILEEDIDISPDFFEFFAAMADFVNNDPTVLAASAWNDNGMGRLVQDNKQIYRSDFFPGLGWMMHRRIWEELKVKWPRAYWDDWLREPKQRQGRHILRPEVCRSYHFGVKGVSNSEFGNYLSDIKLNEEFVPFTQMDLAYLSKDSWDKSYLGDVIAAPLVTMHTFGGAAASGAKSARIEYNGFEGGQDSFVSIAHWAGVMDNIKANVPRTAYKGVVSAWKDGVKLHIAPRSRNW